MANLKRTRFSGWGRNMSSFSLSVSASNREAVIVANPRGATPTGAGRSYGDSALNSNGNRIDTSSLKFVERLENSNVFRCGAGLTIGELSRFAIPRGFYPYVVPGTEFVTIGGAIAADIHGKSHHRVGSFSKKVRRIKLLLSHGEFMEIFPHGDTEKLFNATIGGLGLTGLIIEADIELMPIECSLIEVTEKRVYSLSEMLEVLRAGDSQYFYSVAWIELSGKYVGRGRVLFGNHCTKPHDNQLFRLDADWRKLRKSFVLPPIFRINVIVPLSVKLFNQIWFWKPLAKAKTQITTFMHPLDGIANWNVLYGKRGFLQYQFVVPHFHADYLEKVLVRLRERRIASPLGVLKQLGEESNALLGFAKPGWTLAVDIPVGVSGLAELLDEFDRELVSMGGRVYLVKDSRVSESLLPLMYPSLETWKIIKHQYDKSNHWQSDQSRRLNL